MQNENQKPAKQNWDKGYYIALLLCILAVGLSGYLFTTSLSDNKAKAAAEKPASSMTLPGLQNAAPTSPAAKPAITDELPELRRETQSAPTAAPDENAPAPAPLVAVRPVEGEASQVYSMDHLSFNPTTRDWRTHDGVDLAAEPGANVAAAADGVVESVFDDDFLGKTVTIRHRDGYVTRYANLGDTLAVSVGDEVKAGDVIGVVGASALLEVNAAPHLHFAVTQNGSSVDPEAFLAAHSG